jgi:hypothetical protein
MFGDTFIPLQKMLRERKYFAIRLSRQAVHRFDPESFHFLAVCQISVKREHMEGFQRSCQRWTKEAQRLLRHFRSLEPHIVCKILNLNGYEH